MTPAPAHRRSARPLIVGLALLAVFITAAAYGVWRLQAYSIQAQAERTLSAVAELKASQITSWLKERRGNAELIHTNPLIAIAVSDMLGGHNVPRASADLQAVLDAYRRTYDYREVVMTSPQGATLLGAPQAAAPLGWQSRALAAKATTTNTVRSSDLYLDAAGRVRIDFVAPILSPRNGGAAIAAVTLRADPASFLYPLIQTWPLPSRSGETLLVERRADHVLYLNELRFRKGTALTLTAPANDPTLPAAMAVRGRRGVVQGTDYRDVKVLAALQHVAGTAWFIVAKEDTSDVLGAIRTRAWITAGIALILVALAGAGTLLFWRRRESQISAEIRESEARYRTLVENIPQHIFLKDADYCWVSVNENFARDLGICAEDVVGKTDYDLFPKDLADRYREDDRRVMATGQTEEIEERTLLDGRETWVNTIKTPVRDESGEVVGVLGVFWDVTERKSAEATLRNSEATLRAILDATPFPVALVDAQDDVIHFWSRSALTLFGHTAATATEWYQIAYPDPGYREEVIDRWRPSLERARLSGQAVDTGEYRVTCRDGSVRVCELFAAYLGDRLVVTFHDITEQRIAAEELRETSERLSLACFAGGVGIWELDVVNDALNWDEQMFHLYGVAPDQFSGTYAAWRAGVHPEDRPRSEAELEMALQRDEHFDSEFRVVWPNGTIRTIRSLARVYRDAGGRATKLIGTDYDITELKRTEAEVRSLNAGLEQRVADRTVQLDAANSELEAFAYSVSHDLRAPLRHISGFSGLLAERAGESLDEKSRHYIDTISRSVREMGVLIDDLLQFSRTGRAELHIDDVDMEATLAEALEPLRRETADRDVELSIGALPHVVGDRGLLRQVWANLLGNAVKYTRGRTPAHIEVGARDGDTASDDVFWVRDNGVGFDMAYAHKLFGVFQRLHDSSEFEGTGIGLANVQRIIARHGGRVWAEAEVDQGATFSFSLPRRKEAPS
jgi:PAS domain S-box-containing protein